MHADTTTPRTRGRPRASDSSDTRDSILRAARDVFRELGYEGTTNMKVATHAGLTRPAINYHFTRKRDLFRSVVEVNLTVLRGALDEAARQPTLRGRLHTLIALLDADPEVRAATGFLTIAEIDVDRHPELRGHESDVASALRDFLTASATAARDAGEVRTDTDLPSIVDALHAMLIGIAFRGGAVHDRGRRQAQAAALMTLIGGDLFVGTPSDPADRPAQPA